jgi:hypothetical protein
MRACQRLKSVSSLSLKSQSREAVATGYRLIRGANCILKQPHMIFAELWLLFLSVADDAQAQRCGYNAVLYALRRYI